MMTMTRKPQAGRGRTFEYGLARVRELEVVMDKGPKGEPVARQVLLAGRPLEPTKRFWSSLHLRFGFTGNIFRYFTHQEVFERISRVAGDDAFRWCVEDLGGGHARLLAATAPTAPLVRYDALMELADQYGVLDVSYGGGVVRTTHQPRTDMPFPVAGDVHENRFVLDTPIDGFGRPQVYLSVLRQVCSNGLVAYAPMFRSEVSLGRGDPGGEFSLSRVMDGFNNEEGYGAIRERLESAARSWASVAEVRRLYRSLARANPRRLGHDGAAEGTLPECWTAAFGRLTGDLEQEYGVANLDSLSVKRQRTLPACCKVYDLVNFATEMATHHADVVGGRLLHGFVGDLISAEYDLEGMSEHYTDWRDFFVKNEATAATLATLDRR